MKTYHQLHFWEVPQELAQQPCFDLFLERQVARRTFAVGQCQPGCEYFGIHDNHDLCGRLDGVAMVAQVLLRWKRHEYSWCVLLCRVAPQRADLVAVENPVIGTAATCVGNVSFQSNEQ